MQYAYDKEEEEEEELPDKGRHVSDKYDSIRSQTVLRGQTRLADDILHVPLFARGTRGRCSHLSYIIKK